MENRTKVFVPLVSGLLVVCWVALYSRAQVFVDTLYSFTGGNDGGYPSELLLAKDGALVGITTLGGLNQEGTVLKITTNGAFTVVSSLPGGDDREKSASVLIQASAGYDYGVTGTGGAHGNGAVVRISTNGNFAALYSFTGGEDGELPCSALVKGRDGGLYGATLKAGKHGSGTVFRISTNGTLSILHHFRQDRDGADLSGTLVQARDGALYGVASAGGPRNKGTAFRITTNGAFALLYSFTGGDDGSDPRGPLVEGNDGSLYGVTQGSHDKRSTVFRLNTDGAFTSLHVFPLNVGPNPGLVLGNDGNLYGTTSGGGKEGEHGKGTVFRMSNDGSVTVLYSFSGGDDGANPQSALVKGFDGNFYGTAAGRGRHGYGTIFRMVVRP